MYAETRIFNHKRVSHNTIQSELRRQRVSPEVSTYICNTSNDLYSFFCSSYTESTSDWWFIVYVRSARRLRASSFARSNVHNDENWLFRCKTPRTRFGRFFCARPSILSNSYVVIFSGTWWFFFYCFHRTKAHVGSRAPVGEPKKKAPERLPDDPCATKRARVVAIDRDDPLRPPVLFRPPRSKSPPCRAAFSRIITAGFVTSYTPLYKCTFLPETKSVYTIGNGTRYTNY